MSSPDLLFKAPCFKLKDKEYQELASMSLDDYFKWRQRKMWDFNAQFNGSMTGIFSLDDRQWTTTVAYESKTIRVRNDQRENYYPQKKCGKWVDGKSDSFNPEKEFGKIPDNDLLKIRHNPCFSECSFTAFCNMTITWINYAYPTLQSEYLDTPPPAPSCEWQQWNPKESYVELSAEDGRVWWFVDGKFNAASEFGMSFVDEARTDEDVKNVYFRPTLHGDYGQTNFEPAYPVYIRDAKSTLKAEYDIVTLLGHTNVQNNIKASFIWSVNADREL